MNKLFIVIPILSLALLVAFIVKVNFGDSERPVLQQSEETAKTDAYALSEANASNQKSTSHQPGDSEYDDLEHFVTTVHRQWFAIHPQQRFTFTIDGENQLLLSTVVKEVNHWESVIGERGWTGEFDRLQSTAFQISSPLSKLYDQQKENELIHFQEQLDQIYKRISSES